MKDIVLMYHGVHSDCYPYIARNKDENEWVIGIKAFERHMKILYDSGFQIVLLKEALGKDSANKQLKKRVIISFDDGHETNYLNALPILKYFGFKAEFFITSGWIETKCYMTRKQLLELRKHGMSVQSHGVSHRFLPELDDAELAKELGKSRKVISEIVKDEVFFISYPGGRYDSRTEEYAVKAGYRGSLTSEKGFNDFSHAKTTFGLNRFAITEGISNRHFKAIIENNIVFFSFLRTKCFLYFLMEKFFRESSIEKLKFRIRKLLSL
jgi:peptidoglycan/xylan/chitin deacetylase (PgdA/CDA1 family)